MDPSANVLKCQYPHDTELEPTNTSCTFSISVGDRTSPIQYHRDAAGLPWYTIARVDDGNSEDIVRQVNIPPTVLEFLEGIGPSSVGFLQGHIHSSHAHHKGVNKVVHRRGAGEEEANLVTSLADNTPFQEKDDSRRDAPYWIIKPLLIGATLVIGLGIIRVFLRR